MVFMALSIPDAKSVLQRAQAGCDYRHNFPVYRVRPSVVAPVLRFALIFQWNFR
jgi:hypothetical protein